jgi:hypothetical protein
MSELPLKLSLFLHSFAFFFITRADSSIAITPKSVIDKNGAYFDTRRKSMTPDFGVWVEGMQDSEKGTFLAHRSASISTFVFEFANFVCSSGVKCRNFRCIPFCICQSLLLIISGLFLQLN